MTAFNPLVAARILTEGPLKRLQQEHEALRLEFYGRMFEGESPWHRTMHELESRGDAAYDNWWSLKQHVEWLYAEGALRVASRIANG